MTARTILYGIFQHVGAEHSAHDTITTEQDMWGSLAQLAAEYDTIAHGSPAIPVGHPPRTQQASPPQAIDDLVETDSFGILTTELRRLEADGHDINDLLPRIIRAGNLEGVEDLGSLLRYRIQKVAATYPASVAPGLGLITGLVPRATGITDPAMRQALEEREQLMQHGSTSSPPRRSRTRPSPGSASSTCWTRRCGDGRCGWWPRIGIGGASPPQAPSDQSPTMIATNRLPTRPHPYP